MTSTPARPAVPQSKAPTHATLQAPAQAPVGPRLKLSLLGKLQPVFPSLRPPLLGGLYSCLQNLRLEASLIAKQAWSEYLDSVAAYCELERGDPEEQKRVMGMPLYHDPGKATINLALPWHNVAYKIADLDLKIVSGHINKRMKQSRPAKPWGYHDFFTGSGYPMHNLEGLVLYPESLALPSEPPPTERTAEDQPFCKVHKHPDDPRERMDVTSGSFSLNASQLK